MVTICSLLNCNQIKKAFVTTKKNGKKNGKKIYAGMIRQL